MTALNSKIGRDLQRLLERIDDGQFLTVVLKTRDVPALTDYLEMLKRDNTSLSYEVASPFGVVVLSASKRTIEQVANRQEVIFVMANKEFTLPSFRAAVP